MLPENMAMHAFGELFDNRQAQTSALGFGGQALVKDVISGIFIVFEDQYGVGDTVNLDGVVGVIEAVELRVTRVRDADGTLWYLRNGEILKVGNASQRRG